MAYIICEDLVVATAFRDKVEFWKPVYGESEEDMKELLTKIRIPIDYLLHKQFLCENSALGNVFCGGTEERYKEYFNDIKNRPYFYQTREGYCLNVDAIKQEVGSYDLNKFFAHRLMEQPYDRYILKSFNFYDPDYQVVLHC